MINFSCKSENLYVSTREKILNYKTVIRIFIGCKYHSMDKNLAVYLLLKNLFNLEIKLL